MGVMSDRSSAEENPELTRTPVEHAPTGDAPTGEAPTGEASPGDAFDEVVTTTRPRRGNRPGSALDRWWWSIQATAEQRRIWYWGGPLAVTLLGAILRFWNLQYPHTFMFDETYYVKDAYTLSQLGYEASWPDGANDSYLAGSLDIFQSDNGEFVVHPPLGKWIIWIGMWIFGSDNGLGWRFMSAVMGTLAIFILAVLTRALFRSTLLGTIAGGLLAIDGLALTMSRIALLDQSLMFFVLLAACTLYLDRRWFENHLIDRIRLYREHKGEDAQPFLGPAIWWRPWLLATGVLLGAACAVKWSGIYFLAFFGVYTVLADMFMRRRYGVFAWYSAAVLKQAPINALVLLVPAFVTYLTSWTGWFLTDGGWGRHWAEEAGHAWTGVFSWVPLSIQSLWHYHVTAYNAALAITSEHSWAANPLTWPLMTRPTLVFRETTYGAEATCGSDSCISTISTIANPIIWWSAQIAVVALVIIFIRTRGRDWRIPFILLPILAGYLPWLLYLKRTVFQIYTVAWLPFLILAIVYCIKLVLGNRTDPSRIRTPAVGLVGIYLGMVVGVSLFFYPLWVGTSIPYWYWQLHAWLPLTWQ